MSDMAASRFAGGTVYKNSGGSHITTDNGTAHITVSVPGMKQGMPIKERIDVPRGGH